MNEAEMQAALKFYEAHLVEGGFQEALNVYGRTFPDVRFMIQIEGLAPRRFVHGVVTNSDPDSMADYAEVAHLNPMLAALSDFTAQRVISTDEFIPRAQIEHSDFFDVYLRPRDAMNSAHGFKLSMRQDVLAMFSATIPRSMSEDDRVALQQSLERIRPHVQRSFELYRQMVLRNGISHGNALVQHMQAAAAVFDAHRRLVHMNRRARRLVDEERQLGLSLGGTLSFAEPSVEAEFDKAVGSLFATGEPGGPIAVPREARHPLLLYVLPAAGREDPPAVLAPFLESAPAYLLYMLDPHEVDPAPTEILIRGFGLTEAEARLAQMLHEGSTLKEAAERSGIAYATARKQLASTTEKLGLRRQSELTAMLAHVMARQPLR